MYPTWPLLRQKVWDPSLLLPPSCKGSDSDRAASSLLSWLEQKRHDQWENAVNSIDFSHSSSKTWSTISKLSGRSGHFSRLCPILANSIASQLVKNGAHKRVITSRKVPPPEGDSISGSVTPEEFVNALCHLKPGKSPVLDSIFPEFILHARSALKSWLYSLCTSCMRQLIIPKIWRRALIVVIPKPNRPFGAQRVIAIYFSCVSSSRTLKNASSLVSNQSSIHYSRKKKRAFNTGGRHGWSHFADARHGGIVFWLRPELCLSISQQSTTLYGIAASPASYCDCTWESHGPLGCGAGWQS